MAAILLVDDEAPLRASIAISLRRDGHTVAEAGSRGDALAALDRDVFDVLLVDLRLPDGDGLTLLREIADHAQDVVVLVVTAYGTIETAVEAMRWGAYDFLQKPFGPERLEACIRRAMEHRRLKAELRRRGDVEVPNPADPTAHLVGRSPAMAEIRRLVRQAAAARVVLITGETGTGKDLVARAVHAAAGDPDAPFVTVNCAGLPEALVESELFGHVRGAFTGATQVRRGLFAEAEGGTLFLDEIGDVPIGLQPRLLRFLESGEVRAVGADHTSQVDCRILAATQRDLPQAVRDGRLRQDLLYRLDVFRIAIPPLRERPEDLEPLATRFLERIARRFRRGVLRLEPGTVDAMQAWSWPGNVRELEHALERAALLCETDELPLDLVVPEPALKRRPMLPRRIRRRRSDGARWPRSSARTSWRCSAITAAIAPARRGRSGSREARCGASSCNTAPTERRGCPRRERSRRRAARGVNCFFRTQLAEITCFSSFARIWNDDRGVRSVTSRGAGDGTARRLPPS